MTIMETLNATRDTPSTTASAGPEVRVRRLGLTGYEATWRAMQEFSALRGAAAPDELWLTEHPRVYTLGVAARSEHLPRVDGGIPVVRSDRGGQVTYHAPGQLIAYLLLDLKRRTLTVRPLVRIMEQAVIDLLALYSVAGERRDQAPGVYVAGAKIAALGLRVRNGCCYHGIAFNVDMDLAPFDAIDPCGFPGLKVTQTRDLGFNHTVEGAGLRLAELLAERLDRA